MARPCPALLPTSQYIHRFNSSIMVISLVVLTQSAIGCRRTM